MDQIKDNFLKIQKLAEDKKAQVELLYSESEKLNLGYKQKKLDKFESIQSQIAGLRVIIGSSQGYAYTENLSEASLLNTFNEAFNNAQANALSADKTNKPINLVKPTSLKIIDPKFSEIPITEKKAVAEKLEAQCLSQDKIQSVPWAGFSESQGAVRVLNSAGVDCKYKFQYYSAYAYPLAKDGESSKMGGESMISRDFKDIDVNHITSEAVKRAKEKLNAKTLKTGNYATIITSDEFVTMINMFESYFSAKQVFEGKSLLKGKIGEKIASPLFTLVDNPLEEALPGYRPFDSEGATSLKTTLIDQGEFKTFITNLEYSEKMNLPHTAHAARSPAGTMSIGCSNLIVPAGKDSMDQLITKNKTTVVITEFTGGLHAGCNETTGEFSMPAEGLLYEDGKLVGPVDQFVVSGNILETLKKITALSNKLNSGSSGRLCPDVLISELSFAGA